MRKWREIVLFVDNIEFEADLNESRSVLQLIHMEGREDELIEQILLDEELSDRRFGNLSALAIKDVEGKIRVCREHP